MSEISFWTTGLYIGFINLLLQHIPWDTLYLFLRFFDIYYYSINDRYLYQKVQNKIKYSTMKGENEAAIGYFIGKWFTGYISNPNFDDRYVRLICTEKIYKSLTESKPEPFCSPKINNSEEDDPEEDSEESKQISVFERSGTYSSFYYRRRDCEVKHIEPKFKQRIIMDKIKEIYGEKGNCVALLHGDPGTGKSMLGFLLAIEYNGKYCNTMNLCQPGDSLNELYNYSQPTKEKPLIVAMDEIDKTIQVIHEGIPSHKEIPITIHNKSSWNRFFDDVNRGMYPYVILLLTMNQQPDAIRKLDPSYIREGRVDAICSL
jgi:hypothetical protein